MLSHHSSRTASRKSLRRRPFPLLVFVAMLVCAVVPAQIMHESSVRTHEAYVSVSLAVSGAEPDQLFTNLHEGLSARLEYAMRLVERRSMPASILGPRLVREFHVMYEMRWDPYRRRYTAESHDGAFYTFRNESSLWSFIFHLSDYRIPWEAFVADRPDAGSSALASTLPSGRYELQTRVVYDPIVFVPGLTILSVLPGRAHEQSTWTTHPIEVPQ